MVHVIIAGGSSGIGAALAAEYGARGAGVSLIARRGDQLAMTRQALEAAHGRQGARFRAETADVCDQSGLDAAVAACEADFGPCDLFICSAGIVLPGVFDGQKKAAFDAQIATNLTGTANCVRSVYPGMKARRRGQILIVSSGAGLIGLFGYSAYSASKFALHGFAEALRAEARPHGVSVSICFPPDTDTPQWAGEQADRPEEAKAIAGTAGLWSAAQTARAIAKGLDRNAFEIFLGRTIGLLGRYGSLVGPLVNRWVDWKILRVGKTGKRGD